MINWKSFLQADPLEWLLEADSPSVRYFTLTEIMGESPYNKNVIRAKKEILKTGPVPAILAKQVNGLWGESERYYLDKYKGTSWQLIILAELGVTNENNELKIACDFILENAQDREGHGFSYHTSAAGGGRHGEVIPCLTGNMVWALIKLGYYNDERVRNAVQWITTYQRFDDVTDTPPSGWPYDRYDMCWGRHTCHMGVVKALKALAAIPREKRAADMQKTIDKGIEYLLKHSIYKKSHDLSKVSKPGWLKFGFPLMYQTDALEIASILTDLGCKDKRMLETMELIVSKQDAGARWKLENTFNGRWITDIEVKGKPSKWITLRALRTLKKYYD
jgi:hypothetical protein